MGRENKNQAVAALHRENILNAAETLYTEKGYTQTTIDDIAKKSGYSRRTIYAYYEGKDDILHHIVEKGLLSLRADLEKAVQLDGDFLTRYRAIGRAMSRYQSTCPQSMENVNRAAAGALEGTVLPVAVKRILALGTEINRLLVAFLDEGKKQGVVRQEIDSAMTVYVLWSGITSLLTLVQTKGPWIEKQFSVTRQDFLDYGLKQLINSVLEVRI